MHDHAAPTLLLIHGFPLDHTVWNSNVEALREVAPVIAPDLRGFGTGPSTATATSMEHYAEDLHHTITARSIGSVVLCGLSMGGYIALAFLQRWPQMVRGIILCNTRSTADTDEGKQGREATAIDALTKGSAVIARAMAPKVLSQHTRATDPELAKTIEAMMARQQPEAIAAASRAMAQRPDRTHVLRNANKPTLVITGEHDTLMPLPTSEAMAAAAQRSTLVVLPHAGHLSNVEAPAHFNQAVIDFLRTLPDA